MTSPALPIQAFVEAMGQCAIEVTSRPTPIDAATLLLRGDASKASMAAASAAWALIDPEDARLLYLICAALSSGAVAEALHPLPASAPALIAAIVVRTGPSMRTPEALQDKLKHEEIGRTLASALGVSIMGERDEASRFLLDTVDSANNAMRDRVAQYQTALQAAKSAIDEKHRPSRPYGE